MLMVPKKNLGELQSKKLKHSNFQRLVNLEKTALKSRDYELRNAQNESEIERARAIQVSLQFNVTFTYCKF